MKRLDATPLKKESICIQCGKVTDMASGIGKPKPGDISICFGCCQLTKYNEDLQLVLLDTEELENLKRSTLWPEIQKFARAIKDGRNDIKRRTGPR